MKTNIFLNAYQQPENKLTYNFFALLEILNSKTAIEFLISKQTSEKPITNIKTVFGGGETNPDGSFDIRLNDKKTLTVYYENKTNRRGLDAEQLKGHLKRCKQTDVLLVTSPRKSDIDIIKEIGDARIIFKTWQEISLFFKNSFQDNPIVLQFVEYGKKSGEFDELGEIYSEDIKVFCEYLKIDFDKKAESIFRNFIHEVELSKFGFNNVELNFADNWGRKGVEINLKNSQNRTYGQWSAVSIYYDTYDIEMAFKKNVPDMVFFWEVQPDLKHLLQSDKEFVEIINSLMLDGFESNLNNELTPNEWRLLVYRQPISEFQIINVQLIISFTETVLSKILKNNATRHNYFLEFF